MLSERPNITTGKNALKYTLHTFRRYGQPKLPKPKELKGVKQSFSVDYIPKKCRCAVFLHGNDVWIKHGDYFSPSMKLSPGDIGAPLDVIANKYLNKKGHRKFVYSDAWGSIVLRREAWIRIRNLRYWLDSRLWVNEGRMILTVREEVTRQIERLHGWQRYDLTCSDMARFIERVVDETIRCDKGRC